MTQKQQEIKNFNQETIKSFESSIIEIKQNLQNYKNNFRILPQKINNNLYYSTAQNPEKIEFLKNFSFDDEKTQKQNYNREVRSYNKYIKS